MSENEKPKELGNTLGELVKKSKTARESEKIKQEDQAKKTSIGKSDNFLYDLQAEIVLLEEREKQDRDYVEKEQLYPKELDNLQLEVIYIALLYSMPNAISKYYFTIDLCFFSNSILLNLYRSIIFTEGEAFAPAQLKDSFAFPKVIQELYDIKQKMLNEPTYKRYSFELIYQELKKLFILKKNYIAAPTKSLQNKILEIKSYDKYNAMSAEEVESAIKQLEVTNQLSQVVLNKDVAKFWMDEKNNLRQGIPLPFSILTKEFKGCRRGETMAYAMPSNAGKSRFTVKVACHMAFVHHKRVLIVSNEMSEEKMRLCLLTTVINDPEIRKLHQKDVIKTEGELLEFKFRPDDVKTVRVDKEGYILREDGETQEEFIKRLEQESTEFRQVIEITNWINEQVDNSIYFVHLTQYTNNDLHEVIINYHYKEGIEYVFYDTLKTDVNNIGNYEELKKTATLLSEIAQQFDLFIASSIQLLESSTLPINLTINDLSVSKNIKEVLDILSLIKQVNARNYKDYEYSSSDRFVECKEIEPSDDPDIRYYICVVDKNRAGAKPRVLFRLNLAYNEWVELGYVRLKEE